MANKVFNMEGGLHSAAAYAAFENAMYGSCVASADDYVATAGTGMNVSLSAGNGLISTGTGFARRIASDSANTIAITAAASSDRIDSIVAYIDNGVTPTTSVVDNTNDILKFIAVAGTPAATPSAPTTATIQSAVGAGNPYMVLWNVTIPANATALTNATFTDVRTIASPEGNLSALQDEIDTIKNSFNLSTSSSQTFTASYLGSNVTCDGIFYLSQSSNSATFKAYGNIYITRSASSAVTLTLPAITGLSGYYGIKTNLKLDNPPTTAFVIAAAGVNLRVNSNNTDTTGSYQVAIAVGTDGYIYLGAGTSSSLSIAASSQLRWIIHPCLYFNTNFGDV